MSNFSSNLHAVKAIYARIAQLYPIWWAVKFQLKRIKYRKKCAKSNLPEHSSPNEYAAGSKVSGINTTRWIFLFTVYKMYIVYKTRYILHGEVHTCVQTVQIGIVFRRINHNEQEWRKPQIRIYCCYLSTMFFYLEGQTFWGSILNRKSWEA